eukprot:CAMPEP_0117008624 /NCGR_PEP_ID=MMETSP0472-20121206/8066_1 /TAXON_ID=693140 ORGANISM="Tiarina fusus, Strain LIS" /NCGR_SAMPLE_ID=MMETSP0472 /ASSEMBLY_ACC=CAM_ASM_000603 /LENGTH=540 /DNA_ID=CAMNT_0004710703 /DNA_START=120 /DNA_END=1739 /DNA_ORIENTATION=-
MRVTNGTSIASRLVALFLPILTLATDNVTYTLLPDELTDQETTVWSLAYNPVDPTELASGSEFTAVHLWNVSSALPNPVVSDVLEESSLNEVVYAMAFYGPYLAIGFSSCSILGTVQIWDTDNGVIVSSYVTHELDVWALAISTDGRTLASASQDWTIRLWDIAGMVQGDNNPQLGLVTLIGHEGTVFDVAYSPVGSDIVSGSIDGTVRIWGNPPEEPEGNFQSNLHTLDHGGVVRAVSYSPDGSILLSAGDDGIIRVWNTTSYSLLTTLAPPTQATQSIIFELSFEPTNSISHVASISDSTVAIWNYLSYELLETFPVNGGRSVQYSPDGTQLAAGSFGKIQLWDIDFINNSSSPDLEQPSNAPTILPVGDNQTLSTFPSLAPMESGTLMPSESNSAPPSAQPTANRLSNDTTVPDSTLPSSIPSDAPSLIPSTLPSDTPSLIPSGVPSPSPSVKSPSRSNSPSFSPLSTSPGTTDTPSSGPTSGPPTTPGPTINDNIFFQTPLPSAPTVQDTEAPSAGNTNVTDDDETDPSSSSSSSS